MLLIQLARGTICVSFDLVPRMSKQRSIGLVIVSIVFSIVMNLPLERGLGLFALVMIVLPLISLLCSLVIYFLLSALDTDFRNIATVLACGINVYCGLMLRLNLPVPFE